MLTVSRFILVMILVAVAAGCTRGYWIQDGKTAFEVRDAYIECKVTVVSRSLEPGGWRYEDPHGSFFWSASQIRSCMAFKGYRFARK